MPNLRRRLILTDVPIITIPTEYGYVSTNGVNNQHPYGERITGYFNVSIDDVYVLFADVQGGETSWIGIGCFQNEVLLERCAITNAIAMSYHRTSDQLRFSYRSYNKYDALIYKFTNGKLVAIYKMEANK